MFGDTSSAGLRVSERPCAITLARIQLISNMGKENMTAASYTSAEPAHRNHETPVGNWAPKMRCTQTCRGVPESLGSVHQTSRLSRGAHLGAAADLRQLLRDQTI